ncbi:MAG: tripartite tricarboxylate transporter TctB family protein, partial [Pseudomonadota bacterium]
ERIGPGLFARWLSASAIAVSAIWLAAALLKRAAAAPARNAADDDAQPAQAKPSATAGIGLLGGVAAFALAFPALGLIAASALAALISGWGAGERRPVGLAASTLAGALAALGVGLTLLPPGARLWPQGL